MATDYFGIHVPFLDMLGVKAELDAEGRPFVSVDVRPELMNSFHVTHGGVIMTLLDVAMAMSARVSSRHKGGAITVDMSMSFLRPASGRTSTDTNGRPSASSSALTPSMSRKGTWMPK